MSPSHHSQVLLQQMCQQQWRQRQLQLQVAGVMAAWLLQVVLQGQQLQVLEAGVGVLGVW